MKVKDLVPGVWDAAPIKIRNMLSSKDLSNALSSKVIAQTVTVKNSSTGEIIGKRTIYQK